MLGRRVTAKRTRTSKGEFMLFLTLEDDTDSFEVTLFPKVYRRTAGTLNHKGPYLVTGRVDDDNGALTVTADKVEVWG